MDDDDVHVSKLEHHKDVPALIEALRHPDEAVRIHAAQARGRVGDERAIPVLWLTRRRPTRRICFGGIPLGRSRGPKN